MKTLLLGYSDIARRRMLPALRALGSNHVDIASRSAASLASGDAESVRLFRDYDVALKETDATVVYVSTVNSAHGHWARKALEHGFHVIVDKPAFLSLQETRELVELAAGSRLCISEATVYDYHPRIALARRAFQEAGTQPTSIVAAFSFPALPASNFRHRKECGGGALWDLGPYAVTPGRVFFGAAPLEIVSRCPDGDAEVETTFCVTAIYPKQRTYTGVFGYGTGYLNRLDILGPDMLVTLDRAFSPPPREALPVNILHRNRIGTLSAPAGDSFEFFLRDVFAAISTGNHARFSDRILADAEQLARLRASAAMPAPGRSNASAGEARSNEPSLAPAQ